MSEDEGQPTFELDLDWDDILEAYLGSLAALLTLLIVAYVFRACRPRRH